MISVFSAPQGVMPPELSVISDTSIRISWTTPVKPNGVITEYRIYVDDRLIEEVLTSQPGSYVLDDLIPYTVYTFHVRI